jgi:hypothetical protein
MTRVAKEQMAAPSAPDNLTLSRAVELSSQVDTCVPSLVDVPSW